MSEKAAAILLALAFAAGGVVGLGATGCALTGIRGDEISDAPIAFLYFDAETTRLRAEKCAEKREERGVSASGTSRSQPGSVASVKEIARLLQKTFGVREPEEKRYQGRLALLDPRTGEVTVVEGARKGAVPQDWSSDHTRLLFSQVVHDEKPHLFEFDVTTGDVRRLTYGRTAHPEGCYGPDGRIVFTSVDTTASQGNARIMITDPGGDGPRQLSGSEYAYYPACAPDGSAVAFSTLSVDGRVKHVVVRSPVLTGDLRVISPGKEPAFSADGRWIVFSARLKRNWTIWRVRPDGTGRSSLGRGGYDEQRPGLSPDNQLIVYVADTRFHQQLYLRRVDGTGDRILLTQGDGDRPVW
jgi:Tol biopolymer transport system component